MKFRWITPPLLIVTCLIVAACAEEPTEPHVPTAALEPQIHALRYDSAGIIPGSYIVRLAENVNANDIPDVALALTTPLGGSVEHIYQHVLHGFSPTCQTEPLLFFEPIRTSST